jgi:hypothetical protein
MPFVNQCLAMLIINQRQPKISHLSQAAQSATVARLSLFWFLLDGEIETILR